METTKNIFDTKDTSDLPDDLSSGLKINSKDQFEVNIIELFSHAKAHLINELDIDMITVAYYRKNGNENGGIKSRKQIATKVYNMAKGSNPSLESVERKKGVYILKP